MTSIASVGPAAAKPEDTVPSKAVQTSAAPAPGKTVDSASISPQAKQLLASDTDHDGGTDKAGTSDVESTKKAGGGKPPVGAPQAAPPASANVDATTKKVAVLRKQGLSVADIAQRVGKSEAQVKAMIAATQH